MHRGGSFVRTACIALAFVVLVGCNMASPTPGPYTANEVLGALDAHGLQYFDHGASDDCWEHTPLGPRRYEGNGAPFVMWVYPTGNDANPPWQEYAGSPTLPNGLENRQGCFPTMQMWVIRRGNIVIAFEYSDPSGAGTPSEVADIVAAMRPVTASKPWQKPASEIPPPTP